MRWLRSFRPATRLERWSIGAAAAVMLLHLVLTLGGSAIALYRLRTGRAPLWFTSPLFTQPVVIALFLASITLMIIARRRGTLVAARLRGLICPDCLYSLAGLAEAGRCPECGKEYTHAALRVHWRERYPIVLSI